MGKDEVLQSLYQRKGEIITNQEILSNQLNQLNLKIQKILNTLAPQEGSLKSEEDN